MRLLFAHDHRFLRGPDDRLYSIGSFPAWVWERYLRHFERVHVIARDGGELPRGSELAPSTGPAVDVEFVPSLASVRHALLPSRVVERQIEAAVARADAVVARLPSEIGLRAASAARRLGKPYAVEVVGCALDSYSHHGAAAGRLYARFALRRMQQAVARAPLALYVTSAWLQRRYPCPGFWSSASNVEIVAMTETERTLRQARLAELWKGRALQLGTIASLQLKTKGVQTAISALALLRSRGLDFRYSVLGPGDITPWQELARKRGLGDLVCFDGTRPPGEGVRRWLDEIDIHLQPSFQEGLPRATIEAMSRGAACIGSTCGGIPELLSPERTHRPGDVAALAECIRRLATDPAAIAEASGVDLKRAEDYESEALTARRDLVYARLRALAEARGPGGSPPGV